MPLNHYLRRTASACLLPLAQRAARAYVAGPELNDAVRLADELAQQDFASTLGFWDGEGDSPRAVADHYLAALDALAKAPRGGYLSIKLPAIGDSRLLLGEVLGRARQLGLRVHFDSLGPETADLMWAAVADAASSGVELGCSLPGRWRRSVDDAARAIRLGVVPRVVKGQWADPAEPERDPRGGFLEVIDRLAGRAPRVAVASHDAPLAREAIRRLKAAGSSCELELLYGLPQRASLAVAASEGVPVRFYVPYGRAYLPYCLGQAQRQPWLLWWLLRDSLAAMILPTGRTA